ncbi:Nucleoside-diphosphate-sugar epimerase [Pseudooceanicola antarcticus]|uniref:Epimerase n=1 Tax=Pseudooceanicola antarcticus TaxID=1247613 RepID=A0A285J5H1_9RHOB|nr:NAD-dependent epimerase/dehydratase family protein [Pseudooceanicola antarcticus]PJE26854.1 epimerase [Pseudooceanicola antarcticus]SNY55524.1 Nucleoside-diphosphate-sugar epimerase [Pseudooceanicola antarcticus]
MTKKIALVLGATGGVGSAIARALLRHGWTVRGMARNLETARARGLAGVDWLRGDAMQAQDVARAAEGVALIVHAVNPPNYRNWDKLVLPMIDNTIAAARANGARIMLPGTIYNFDPAEVSLIRSDSPQRPRSVKGRIRVKLEERLRAASANVPVLILRAGDFYGPDARSSWLSEAMVQKGKPVKRIINPARTCHTWAYLPDLAEATARLLEVPERLSDFEVLQFSGYDDPDGQQMAQALQRVVGHKVPVWRFPWWVVKLVAPFWRFGREMAEVAPHWHTPMRLDNSRLEVLIGPEPRTALDDSLRASLIDMGCLRPETLPAPQAA